MNLLLNIEIAVGPQLRFETLGLASGESRQADIVRVIHEVVNRISARLPWTCVRRYLWATGRGR